MTDHPISWREMLVAGLRSGDWLHWQRVRAYVVIMIVACWAAVIYAVMRSHGILITQEPHITTEFMSFYAAGRLVDLGTPLQVYDMAAHKAMEVLLANDPDTPFFTFFYPPVFLLICAPLAFLPYLLAFFVWIGAMIAVCFTALRRILGSWHLVWPVLGFPALYEATAVGENSLLSAGLFGHGLLLIDRRPFPAGMILGCLCYKPHFALPVVVALLAGRRWSAIAGGLTTAALLSTAATLLFGWPIWDAYIKVTRFAANAFEQGGFDFHLFMSSFGAVRLMGIGVVPARIIQGLTAIFGFGAVAWLWWRGERPAIRNAMLCVCLPVCVPVMLDYDMAISLVGIAWFMRDALDRGFQPWEKLALLGLVAASLFNRTTGSTLHIGVIPWLTLVFMVVLLRRSYYSWVRLDV